MNEEIESNDIRWIVARLGDDLNWWLESTNLSGDGPAELCGILDPRQVTHLAETLEQYEAHGLRPGQLETAFKLFSLESEIDEGRVRLAINDSESFAAGSDVFALPIMEGEEESPYALFLEALATARIRKINAERRLTEKCTEEEMYAELDAIDATRYFNADAMHCFEEITQILDWSPAEWDDSSPS
jgi:hypothetical protein